DQSGRRQSCRQCEDARDQVTRKLRLYDNAPVEIVISPDQLARQTSKSGSSSNSVRRRDVGQSGVGGLVVLAAVLLLVAHRRSVGIPSGVSSLVVTSVVIRVWGRSEDKIMRTTLLTVTALVVLSMANAQNQLAAPAAPNENAVVDPSMSKVRNVPGGDR